MDRREAMRAAAALTLGAATAGCDSPKVSRPSQPAASSAAAVTAPTTSAPPPDEIRHGPRTGHGVALTFHGQGDPVLVNRLLDELARVQVKVTVLAVGTWPAASPELARRVLADGHDLGNHTQHHADIKQMSAAQAQTEIGECAHALTKPPGGTAVRLRSSHTRPHPRRRREPAPPGRGHWPGPAGGSDRRGSGLRQCDPVRQHMHAALGVMPQHYRRTFRVPSPVKPAAKSGIAGPR
jgi:peptidoglycan/xylan/chitin deacetylase (PgdA/CDA1 family)